MPWEEPSAFFGGHYNILWPKDVCWTKVRQPGQPFVEEVAGYGKVYHTGSAADVQQMMDAEGAYWYHAHPRTKSTPAIRFIFDKPYVRTTGIWASRSSRAWGRTTRKCGCATSCFDAIDTMNNMSQASASSPST